MPLPTYEITCTQNTKIAHDVYEIKFTKPADFSFKAGQYVMILTPLVEDESDVQVRAYSIASTPDEDELLFVIRLVENGRMSRFIVEKLEEGTVLQMQGPLGVFCIPDECEKDMLFVCTSTGNAPFRSMVKQAAEHGVTKNMDVLFGVRHEEDAFWENEFGALEEQYPHVKLHTILSKPTGDWGGKVGHVQDLFENIDNLKDRKVYICGNPAMADEVKKICLEDLGMEKADVHVEGYI